LACPAQAAENSLRTEQDASTVSVFVGERPVLQYRYGDELFKPYVSQLYSPGGVQILRDSPSDHKHHHALMFAVGVGGVDFWSEKPDCGRQKGRAPSRWKPSVRSGAAAAGLVHELTWVGPGSNKAILVERRTIEVSTPTNAPAATLATWRSTLEVPKGKDAVTLSGAHYFGLGMRFVTAMDECGRFFHSEGGKPGDVVRGSERLTAAKWCAYTASADGKPVTVALFDHPSNPRHPARMFTMCPFAYLSATLNLWKEPMTLRADHPLELCYGAALWDGQIEPAVVDTAYQRWAESTR
jgi:hypothetical protein